MFFLRSRQVLKLEGVNVIGFLNALVTADLTKLQEETVLFSALLNAKGRFLFDFFIHLKNGDIFLDVNQESTEGLIKTLRYYDLLSEFKITLLPSVKVFTDENFLKSWQNGKIMGRILSENVEILTQTEEKFNEARIELCLPDGALELKQEKSIILEYNYEEAHGISFEKGCYIGQELMNRTKRQGEIRKHLKCILNEDLTPKDNLLSTFGSHTLILTYKN